jgi:hypothetical protein
VVLTLFGPPKFLASKPFRESLDILAKPKKLADWKAPASSFYASFADSKHIYSTRRLRKPQ